MNDTPIPVRYDLPIPEGHGYTDSEKLRTTLRAMRVGGSFEWPNCQHPWMVARRIGMKIKVAKLDNGTGYTIWKLSDSPTLAVGHFSNTASAVPFVGLRRSIPVTFHQPTAQL